MSHIHGNDISEKWDPKLGTFGGTWDPRLGTDLVGDTRDPRTETLKVGPETQDLTHRWDPRPRTLKVGPETQDAYFTWDLKPETQDTERGIWDTYDKWHPRPKTNISCRTWGTKTMIQMNLIKFPINRIWVIIFLISNHIAKRRQHL